MKWLWPKSDWWLALLIVVLVTAAGASGQFAVLDNAIYAWGMRFSAQRDPGSRIAIVSLDAAVAASPDKLNQALTDITRGLAADGAGVIGFALPPDQLAAAGNFGDASGSAATPPPDDSDEAPGNTTFLASIAAAHNVVLAATTSGTADSDDTAAGAQLPDSILLNSLPAFGAPPPRQGGVLARWLDVRAPRVQLNMPPAPLASAAVGVGVLVDSDSFTGAAPAVVRTGSAYMPGFALEIAARALDLNNLDMIRGSGRKILLGERGIPTDSRLRLYPYFYGDRATFPHYPAASVAGGLLPKDTFRNKIVLVGVTAADAVGGQTTPIGGNVAPVVYQANVIASLLNDDLFTLPPWGIGLSGGLLFLIALYFVFVVPRLSQPTAIALSVVFALLLLNSELLLLIGDSLWLPFAVPVVALVLTHLALAINRYANQRLTRFQSDLSETNRLLGESYQEQGQLDLAFARYQRCLPSSKLAANFYDLGLSYESKRQFAKAAGSFREVQKIVPGYLDVDRRITRLDELENRMMLGGGATQPVPGLILDPEGLSKPMLGRYRIEQQIGRGSMGIVYLGKDPRIGRTVAIKTMSFAQQFQGDDIGEVSRRFFQEAKAAGRLSHPNIVTIYDVGEDQGIAYIAMDYLSGENLKTRCQPDNLLDLDTVMIVGARVADALDYAHSNHVIHRDVKPANIVYEPDSGRVKVTDFGAAFLADAGATRSALVLGSPSYMSPEQVQGQPLDGRSDIFSLGITLFQLATGQLPFTGQPIASLMYRIATEPHPDIQSVRPEVPDCLARVIEKALKKNPAHRYQTGAAMARDLRLCLSTWHKLTAEPAAVEAGDKSGFVRARR